MIKRIFDIVVSILSLVLLSPLILIISVLIRIDSKGAIIYKSRRVGKDQVLFDVYKFRTMYLNSDHMSITVGNKDNRITPIGYYLRKYKLDELPQLINVVKGQMSLVGPRPDVPEFADYYLEHMPEYYNMKPGISSESSVYFSNECELYCDSENPEADYIHKTIPKKVELDSLYYNNQCLLTDLKIILKTLKKLFIS